MVNKFVEKIYSSVFNSEDIVIPSDGENRANQLLEGLSERDRTLLMYLYKDGLSRKQVGVKFEISEVRVGQVEKVSIRRITSPKRKDFLMGSGDLNPTLDKSIDYLNLQIRTYRALRRYQITTVEDLVNHYKINNGFTLIRTLGEKGSSEIIESLKKNKFI